MAFKKYERDARLVAMKYNSPRLTKEVWASALGIPLKKFEGLPDMFSWGQAVRLEKEKRAAKK